MQDPLEIVSLRRARRSEVRAGARLVVYLAAVLLLSAIGSKNFGGTGLIPVPWDSVVVAAIGLAAYVRGVRDASAYVGFTGRAGHTGTGTAASGEPGPSQAQDLRSSGQ